MTDFGDFANIDVDRLLRGVDEQLAKSDELQRRLPMVVGRGEDADGMVVVEYAQEGIRTLDIHPKAMRLAAAELSEKVKEAVHAATTDLQREIEELMAELFGTAATPSRLMNDPEALLKPIRQAEANYDRAFENVMGELDRIRRDLDL
ncbi:YbaB/EbfC family nucleoid-associated protein [Nonomuraea sp. GTA35]|uniref:YbaB/EbfC family nucleoid-associated protein n=1 Tax=Nonomuraea sp. GTA35 TaxID=1676746 RepID=UPI0035C0C2C5